MTHVMKMLHKLQKPSIFNLASYDTYVIHISLTFLCLGRTNLQKPFGGAPEVADVYLRWKIGPKVDIFALG